MKTAKLQNNKKKKGLRINKTKRKGKRMNTKQRGKGKQLKSRRSKKSRCSVSTTCLEKATKYMKVLKDNVENYFKQEKRMTTQNKTAGKINHCKVFLIFLSYLREQEGENGCFYQKF